MSLLERLRKLEKQVKPRDIPVVILDYWEPGMEKNYGPNTVVIIDDLGVDDESA